MNSSLICLGQAETLQNTFFQNQTYLDLSRKTTVIFFNAKPHCEQNFIFLKKIMSVCLAVPKIRQRSKKIQSRFFKKAAIERRFLSFAKQICH
jgi:hypothetical protein